MSLHGLRQRSERYREQGLCAVCGAEPEPDRNHCSEHLRYWRIHNREKRRARKSQGLCIYCGKGGCNCSGKRNERARQRRAQRIRDGLCSECGGEREDEQLRRCEVCREMYRSIAQRRQTRNRSRGLCRCGRKRIPGYRECSICKKGGAKCKPN